ncbi:hypothetical protein ACJX0J_008346, partial [Zea mays]
LWPVALPETGLFLAELGFDNEGIGKLIRQHPDFFEEDIKNMLLQWGCLFKLILVVPQCCLRCYLHMS